MRHEQKFTTRFKHWLEANEEKFPNNFAAAWEIKVTLKKCVAFSMVNQHQIDALMQVRHKNFVFKIPDAGFQNPFDLFSMKKSNAFFVFAFLKTRLPADVYVIDIDKYLKLKSETLAQGRKSLTEEILNSYHASHYKI